MWHVVPGMKSCSLHGTGNFRLKTKIRERILPAQYYFTKFVHSYPAIVGFGSTNGIKKIPGQ